MTIFIDLAGSWIVRVAMVSAMLGLTVTMNEAVYKTTQYSNTKETVDNVADVMYTDLNLAGYNVPYFSGSYWYPTAFGDIKLRNLYFYGDLNDGGIPEEINYYTEYNSTTKLYSLYRWVNRENGGNRLLLGKNFKDVSFEYYNVNGVRIYDGSEWDVASVRVKLTMEVGGVSSSEGISSVLNDFWIYPPNL